MTDEIDKDPITTALSTLYKANEDAEANGEEPEFDLDNLQDIIDVPVTLAKDYEHSMTPDYKQDVMDDYGFIRQSLIISIEEAQRALKDARIVARVAPSPNVFDSISKLLKTISDNTEKLFKLHKEINKASKPEPKPSTTVVEGDVVLASTEDIIRRAREKNGIVDD